MRIDFTDKMLVNYTNKGIEKSVIFTDRTGLRISIRPTCNQQILANHKLGSLVGIHFKAIFNKDNNRYVFNLGTYPTMTLDEARKQYADMRIKFKTGEYFREKEQSLKKMTFGELFSQWKKIKFSQITESTQKKYDSINSHITKLINYPVYQITPNVVLDLLHELLQAEKFATAEYIANVIRAVLDYAVFLQVIPVNPLTGITKFMPKATTHHHQSFSDATLKRDMVELFNAFSKQDRKLQCLLFLYFFTLLRNNELRTLKLEHCFETFLSVKTKTLDDFKVPLSTQAQKVIRYLIDNHVSLDNPYVFEGYSENECISKNTLNKALASLGFGDRLKVHGIRTCGRQFMQTIPTAKESIIELCLSHVVGSQVQQAYNRGEYYLERKRIMQIWSDFVAECIGDNFAFVLN